ncbi:MAG: hypothetical protein JNM40_16710 [Myxococcales bacterium]|nr:hypothetical protein [Myxococcales bacterium]
MHIRALVGLVAALISMSGCERRNLDQCRIPDLPCEDGRYCKVTQGATVGQCESSECAMSNDCASDRPNCSAQGRCFACSTSSDCAKQAGAPICDAGRCVACKTSKDCTDKLTPYCDVAAHTCRACQKHLECDTSSGTHDGVCVKDSTLSGLSSNLALQAGMCVPTERVVSIDKTSCPSCTVQDKLNELSAQKPYLRIGEFVSSTPVTVKPVPGLPEVHIVSPAGDYSLTDATAKSVAPNAVLSYSNGVAVTVDTGASVTIEGLTITSSKTGLSCMGAGNPTKVRLLRMLIGENNTGIQGTSGCELSIEQSWIGNEPQGRLGGVVNAGNLLAMDLTSTKFDLINSVLSKNQGMAPTAFSGILVKSATATTPGRIINSTFVENKSSTTRKAMALDCQPATGNISILNSLFLDPSPPAGGTTYIHADCTSTNQKYIGSNDSTLSGTGNVTDLIQSDVFVSPSTNDFRLKSGADARIRDGGLTQLLDGGKNIIPTVDISGSPRGTTKLSIGALEATR